MNTLDTKERVAVVVAVLVVGFFFVFGQTVVTFFSGPDSQATQMIQAPRVEVSETLMGSGEVAMTGDMVVVHYTGTFLDGTVFDSSISRKEPFQFVLGSPQVIAGWNQGLVGMRVGGKRTLVVPSDFGYGPNDYGPIPGGSTLIFEVELLKVEKLQVSGGAE